MYSIWFVPGCQQDFPPTEDVHTVASLLKLFLRELPEPLVPFACYTHFQLAVKSESVFLSTTVLSSPLPPSQS